MSVFHIAQSTSGWQSASNLLFFNIFVNKVIDWNNKCHLLVSSVAMGVLGGGRQPPPPPPVCWANKASRAIFASQLGNIDLLQK